MKRPIVVSLVLIAIFAGSAKPSNAKSAKTLLHVFWYGAKSNKYPITDCNPGPCIPENAVIHQEKIVSGYWNSKYKTNGSGFSIGSFLEDEELMSAFVWSEGLNALGGKKVKSAKVRGEYIDSWLQDKTICRPGPIFMRCGVVDFGGNIGAWGGTGRIPAGAGWRDAAQPFSSAMGFNAQTKKLQAEEDIVFQAPPTRQRPNEKPSLEGKFFEIDITNQVNWILKHSDGQYAIVFLVAPGQNTKGKINFHADGTRNGLGDLRYSKSPWTKDANTCHIIVEESPGHRLMINAGIGTERIDKEDIRAPRAAWIYPKPFSILRSNEVRLLVEAEDDTGGSGVDRVAFFASFMNDANKKVRDTLIGVATSYPYAIAWGYSNMPDQNIYQLSLNFDVVDKAGNHSLWQKQNRIPIVLDRNAKLKNGQIVSSYASNAPVIDGRLTEWFTPDSIVFTNKDNRVVARSQWDRERLFFAVMVYDKNVISRFDPQVKSTAGLSGEDAVELFIDTKHNHNEIPDREDKQFLIAAAGKVFGVIRENNSISETVDLDMVCRPNILGTINDPSDADTGYVLECSIGWEEIGRVPKDNMMLGFEVWNTDIDYSGDTLSNASWSGVGTSNLHNPSEWGNIRLSAGRRWSRFVIMPILLLGISLLVLFKRKRLRLRAALSGGKDEKMEITSAKEFIAQHFSEASLSREKVAAYVGLSPGYFSSLFKKEAGQGFIDFLTRYRIEKAKSILIASQMKVTDIALDVGFSSVETFVKSFKKLEKITPTDFRQKNKGRSDKNPVI